MDTEVLERGKATVTETKLIAGIDSELAKRACNTLGYSTAIDYLNAVNQAGDERQKALDAFTALEIEPFTPESIKKYKQAKLRRANRFVGAERFLESEMMMFIQCVICVFFGAISVIVNTILTARTFIIHIAHRPSVYGWYFTAACAVLLGVSYFVHRHAPEREFVWDERSIRNYNRPIPSFALSRAAELKELCPSLQFSIDELVAGPRVVDPFMVASVGVHEFYIDVWEEPEFEGRRTK